MSGLEVLLALGLITGSLAAPSFPETANTDDCPTTEPLKSYPHPTDCNKYYQCENGTKVEMNCTGNFHYNRVLKVCDFPKYAGCINGSQVTTSTPTPAYESGSMNNTRNSTRKEEFVPKLEQRNNTIVRNATGGARNTNAELETHGSKATRNDTSLEENNSKETKNKASLEINDSEPSRNKNMVLNHSSAEMNPRNSSSYSNATRSTTNSTPGKYNTKPSNESYVSVNSPTKTTATEETTTENSTESSTEYGSGEATVKKVKSTDKDYEGESEEEEEEEEEDEDKKENVKPGIAKRPANKQ